MTLNLGRAPSYRTSSMVGPHTSVDALPGHRQRTHRFKIQSPSHPRGVDVHSVWRWSLGKLGLPHSRHRIRCALESCGKYLDLWVKIVESMGTGRVREDLVRKLESACITSLVVCGVWTGHNAHVASRPQDPRGWLSELPIRSRRVASQHGCVPRVWLQTWPLRRT